MIEPAHAPGEIAIIHLPNHLSSYQPDALESAYVQLVRLAGTYEDSMAWVDDYSQGNTALFDYRTYLPSPPPFTALGLTEQE
jgi:hypothetical protein